MKMRMKNEELKLFCLLSFFSLRGGRRDEDEKVKSIFVCFFRRGKIGEMGEDENQNLVFFFPFYNLV